MDNMVFQVLSGSTLPVIIALIKMYSDIRVLNANLTNLNLELQETKLHHNAEINQITDRIDRKFDKLESLIQELFKKMSEK